MDIRQDYFTLLGMKECYELDLSLLAENYRALQKALHPDRFAHQTEQDKRLSVQYTAYLNQAYSTLISPLGRAQYLLQRQGIDASGETSVRLEPDFLFEQMALRERLEQAASSADPFMVLAELGDEVDQQLKQLQQVFSRLYQQREPAALEAAAMEVRKMQFFTKLQSEIAELEINLDS